MRRCPVIPFPPAASTSPHSESRGRIRQLANLRRAARYAQPPWSWIQLPNGGNRARPWVFWDTTSRLRVINGRFRIEHQGSAEVDRMLADTIDPDYQTPTRRDRLREERVIIGLFKVI